MSGMDTEAAGTPNAAAPGQSAGEADKTTSPRGLPAALARRMVRRYEQLTPVRAMILVLLLGGLARAAHLLILGVNEPLVMGGLFLQFADEIAANGFLLPDRIPYYSEGGLPFLYPPLAFYLLAFLVHVLGLPEGPVINILPVVISTVSIWLFYRLARRILPSWRQAALAAFLFALLPNAMAESVEAAGLAESLGMAMLLWFLIGLSDLYSAPNLRRAILCGVALGLCALSSPGSAVGGTLTAILFAGFFYFSHGYPRGEKLLTIAAVAVTSLLVASPYLIHVVTTGAETFASAFTNEMAHESITKHTVLQRAVSLFTEFPLVYPQVFLWQLLAAVGLLAAVVHSRARAVAVWTLAIFLLIPREGRWLVAPGVAFLCLLAFQALFERARRRLPREGHAWAAAVAVLMILFMVFPYGTPLRAAFGSYMDFADATMLREDAGKAFGWIRKNTPENARVLVIADDFTLEQAAHEMQRTVINVFWGSEFEPANWDRIRQAQRDLKTCTGTAEYCVTEAIEKLGKRMPLYVLAHEDWLAKRSGASPGLMLLHRQGKLEIYRLWPEPVEE